MIDGVKVNIGDTVYVLGIGSGQVTKVSSDGGFSVRTGSGEASYRSGGYVANKRRVYWANPIFITPPNDPVLWRAFTELSTDLYNKLQDLKSGRYILREQQDVADD